MTRLFATLIVLLFSTQASYAQQSPELVEAAARTWLMSQTGGLRGEVAIELSTLDADNLLPPCEALTAFLPAGRRAWGSFSLGMRCDAPTAWTIYLQTRVRVTDDYLVTAKALGAGQIVGPDDLTRVRGDIAALPSDTLTDASQAVGHHARFALAAGHPLQIRMLRIPPIVQQGATVTVVSRGASFHISNSGRALNAAAPGEAVRVRLSNNRIVVGTARHDGTIDASY